MADRDNRRSRVAAFASLPATRLGMFANSGNRQSQNVEDVRDATTLDKILASIPASARGYAGDIAWLYRQGQLRPWRQTVGEHLRDASDLLPREIIPPLRPFAGGGTVDDILSAYSAPVRSWPGEQALDDEARANYQAMHPEAPQKLRPEEAFRGTFLPFRETTEGKHEWAVPGFLMDVADAAKAIHGSSGTSLGPAIRPSQYSPEAFEQILGHGMAGALAGIAGNMPRVLAKPSAGATELGIFGGRSAKTADQAMLAKAEDMAAQGVPREKIWNDTGWFQGVDGKWRYEISDHPAQWKGSSGEAVFGSASDVVPHPDFYAAYPDAAKMLVHGAADSRAASFDPWPAVTIGGKVPDKRSTALHELQHYVQDKEGFSPGANPHMYIDETDLPIRRLMDKAVGSRDRFSHDAQAERDAVWKTIDANRDAMGIPTALYRMNAGETEARAVQARRDLTPDERRARPPWLDYDIPESQQIVRFGDK